MSGTRLRGVILGFVAALAVSAGAFAADMPTVILATTDQGSTRVSGQGANIQPQHPGWQIELFRQVADKVGVKFEFRRMTWKQVLARIKTEEFDAAFNSSYSPERATYGVYPMLDGEPDTTRATLSYSYWLYRKNDSPVTWDGVSFTGLEKPIGAESSAAIVQVLKDHGAQVIEASTYPEILDMLRTGQVDAVAGFAGNIEAFLQADPQRYSHITRYPVPLQRRNGYLMFSQSFYAKNKALVERIWNAIADIWSSPEAAEIRRNYE
jgi:polar amino acid transport system substrate-binding protein